MASSKTPINGGFNGKILYTWGISQLAVLKLPEDLSESLEYESAIWFSHFHGFQVYISCKFGMGVMSYESSSYCHHSLGIRAVSSSHPGWQAWSSMLCFMTLQELNLLTCLYIYTYYIYMYTYQVGKKKPIRSFSRATRGFSISCFYVCWVSLAMPPASLSSPRPLPDLTTCRFLVLTMESYTLCVYIYTYIDMYFDMIWLYVSSQSPLVVF